MREGLHRGHGIEHFARQRRGVGNTVLRITRELSHAAAKIDDGQHDSEQHDDNDDGELEAGDHHHGQSADEHQQIAQTHGDAGANDCLDQRGVRCQSREHFAGTRGLKKLRALFQYMAIHGGANVRRDALAQPGDGIKACRGGHGHDAGNTKQGEEIQVDLPLALAAGGAKAKIDHLLESVGDAERCQGGHDQGDAGQKKLRAVRP